MNERLQETVRQALRSGPFTTRDLAQETGLSYDLLRSWRTGRRRPGRETALKLAAALEERADRLRRYAAALRELPEAAGADD